MIRVAAVGDVHVGEDGAEHLRRGWADLADRADALLLAGDLTRWGTAIEAAVLAEVVAGIEIPVVAVLGNHDHHSDEPEAVRKVLETAGACVLDGEAVVLPVGDLRLGVAGVKGFGGGFPGASACDFGEPEMKAFVSATKSAAARLAVALSGLDSDVRIALLHYSPVAETLRGEPVQIHAFLGSYLLAEAVDRGGADLVLHGHAHAGSHEGRTPGGVPVRNVAEGVLGAPYRVFRLPSEPLPGGAPVTL